MEEFSKIDYQEMYKIRWSAVVLNFFVFFILLILLEIYSERYYDKTIPVITIIKAKAFKTAFAAIFTSISTFVALPKLMLWLQRRYERKKSVH